MLDSEGTERSWSLASFAIYPKLLSKSVMQRPTRREATRCWAFRFGGLRHDPAGARPKLRSRDANPSLGYTELYAERAGRAAGIALSAGWESAYRGAQVRNPTFGSVRHWPVKFSNVQ